LSFFEKPTHYIPLQNTKRSKFEFLSKKALIVFKCIKLQLKLCNKFSTKERRKEVKKPEKGASHSGGRESRKGKGERERRPDYQSIEGEEKEQERQRKERDRKGERKG
jgi:hypothetical protein